MNLIFVVANWIMVFVQLCLRLKHNAKKSKLKTVSKLYVMKLKTTNFDSEKHSSIKPSGCAELYINLQKICDNWIKIFQSQIAH